MVREWVKQAEWDKGTRQDGGLTGAERKESARLPASNNRQGRLRAGLRPGARLQEHEGVVPIASDHAVRRISMRRRNALISADERA